jgi:hypothetical protein
MKLVGVKLKVEEMGKSYTFYICHKTTSVIFDSIYLLRHTVCIVYQDNFSTGYPCYSLVVNTV